VRGGVRPLAGGGLEASGLSQEAAARELEVSVSTSRRWLSGRSEPRYVELWAIVEAWGEHPPPIVGGHSRTLGITASSSMMDGFLRVRQKRDGGHA
jgi:transcriptional regulator with XRE-family HTH domain